MPAVACGIKTDIKSKEKSKKKKRERKKKSKEKRKERIFVVKSKARKTSLFNASRERS